MNLFSWRKRRRQPEDKPSAATERQQSDPVEATINQAREILLAKGVVEALELLRDSPYSQNPNVLRSIHALVWNNQRDALAAFQDAEFLDPIWCQCSVDSRTWLISPLLNIEVGAGPPTGLTCLSCGRTLCPSCAEVLDRQCSCGGAMSKLTRPNGRRRERPHPTEDLTALDRLEDEPESPAQGRSQPHLYFGFDGRLPIGIDPTMPKTTTAAAEDHLGWAVLLMSEGIYYQAEQQLDMGSSAGDSARSLWLRARLRLVQARNFHERRRRNLDHSILASDFESAMAWKDEIKEFLERAMEISPDFGPACLTAAQLYLDDDLAPDYPRALACSKRALELLGNTPMVMLALGMSLRRCGQLAQAVQSLEDAVPSLAADDFALATKELEFARLEASCATGEPDPQAHLQLCRLYFRAGKTVEAKQLCERLVSRRPDEAVAYWGLAHVAFLDFDRPRETRLPEAVSLCTQALQQNPSLGVAHELMGTIYAHLKGNALQTVVPPGDPVAWFRRAVENDPTCDLALASLADHYLDRGDAAKGFELLEQAAALDTQLDDVYFKLAVIYKARRDFEKQEWASKKAKDLAPLLTLSPDHESRLLRLFGHQY